MTTGKIKITCSIYLVYGGAQDVLSLWIVDICHT
jgi:hypothetical protein